MVHASGRRSAAPRWLADACRAQVLTEDSADSGFVHHSRHYRSPDGSLPHASCPALAPFGSITILTLVADHGVWSVVVAAAPRDAALRGLTDPAHFLRKCVSRLAVTTSC
ncbi:MAG: hypothetical protein ACKVWR_05590 [Acidimicrobiales bacterium]